jgi:3-methylcrotonyl-CoA carboxylase alpha subunit
MERSYEYNGESYRVRLTPEGDGAYRAELNGRTIRFFARRNADGSWFLPEMGQTAFVSGLGAERSVWVGGHTYRVQRQQGSRRSRSRASAGGDLAAQMPGQVLEVRVTPGEQVRSGQVMLVLEAMKMEMRLTAPHDGIVRAVRAAAGELVQRGQVLIELESTGPA